jgi:flavin-dependent dehydrogenase
VTQLTEHGSSEYAGPGMIPWDQLWDAVVVGAGPAGAMTALELGRGGKRVLLLDRRAFPRWKVCGATLSPGVKNLLADAGLEDLLRTLGATPLHTLRLGGWSMQADLPLNGSVSISRYALDLALIQEAQRVGVHFCSEARARLGPLSSDRRIVEVTVDGVGRDVAARTVVAADGLGSGLMAQAGVPSQVPSSPRRRLVGLGGVFASSPTGYRDGVIHMAVGRVGYVGLSRVEDGSLNVAAALTPESLREASSPGELVQSLLNDCGWPDLPRLPSEGWKGTPELTRRPQRPGAERLFAVGDAGGYVEPFTGEGVFWALTGARLSAPFIARVAGSWDWGLLEGWSRAHAGLVGRAQRLCRVISWALARPSISRGLIRMLRDHPTLAGPLVRRVGAPIISSG